ncbi:DUF4189 domain-containing protein [Stenotrophomonas sp.]|uniref:DUF4189 domain-containing protein n=1 Tax=Stenotrophomonas sp. TaxID=69392 RepID=UPI0039C9D752
MITRFGAPIVVGLLLSTGASAQQPGSVEYNTVFLPGHGVGDTRSPDPRIRWGALARGDDRALGYTLVGRTKDEAQALAVADCESRGSRNCVVLETFFNSCIAVTASLSDPSNRVAMMSPNGLRSVRRKAMKECGADCEIIYEGCAVP